MEAKQGSPEFRSRRHFGTHGVRMREECKVRDERCCWLRLGRNLEMFLKVNDVINRKEDGVYQQIIEDDAFHKIFMDHEFNLWFHIRYPYIFFQHHLSLVILRFMRMFKLLEVGKWTYLLIETLIYP